MNREEKRKLLLILDKINNSHNFDYKYSIYDVENDIRKTFELWTTYEKFLEQIEQEKRKRAEKYRVTRESNIKKKLKAMLKAGKKNIHNLRNIFATEILNKKINQKEELEKRETKFKSSHQLNGECYTVHEKEGYTWEEYCEHVFGKEENFREKMNKIDKEIFELQLKIKYD